MPETYVRRHGFDWPVEMTSELIDLTVAKKHRIYADRFGVNFPDPHVRLLDAARSLLPRGAFIISPWSEEHAYDFVNYSKNVTWGCASCSKAQPLDATVMTPRGPVTMGEVAVGDLVCTPDGGTATVVQTHDVGVVDEYRVLFRDGASVLCAGDHLWNVGGRGGESRGYTVVDTKSLAGVEPNKVCVPRCAPVGFSARSVMIDPYVMGVLLGDGSLGAVSGNSPLSVTSIDEDILAEFRRRLLPDYELVLTREPTYRLVKRRDRGDKERGKSPNVYIRALRAYGLWGVLSRGKHVPEDYLYNDERGRRDLLAGLLDTDGCCGLTGYGNVSFTTTSKRLADDVAFLVRSLGGASSVSKKATSYKKGGVRVDCGGAYHVSIMFPDDSPAIFKCARKQDRVRKRTRGFRRRYIVSVCETGRRVPMKCLTVSNPDGLYLTNDFIVTHNSNDLGLFTVLHWITDPYDTVCLVGSTSLKALQSRTWESIVRYHAHLKNNTKGFSIPGTFSRTGYAVVNIVEDGVAGSQGAKASIQGRALNDGGTLQGAHLPYVLLLVDEAATLNDQSVVENALVNLRSGATDFRAFLLANPEDWSDPSCVYCEPEGGDINSVNVDTGEWMSSQGFHVRHHDGLKSPRVLDPTRSDWSHLLGPGDVAESLKESRGNMDAPIIWKMVRGFPRPSHSSAETVLEYAEASARKCMEPFEPTGHDAVVAVAAGCDPAWSPEGDEAVWQGVSVVISAGTPMLVFGDPRALSISASTKETPLEQMSRQAVDIFLDNRQLDPVNVGYDSSGNQSLCGAVAMRTGLHGLDVNNSERSSDTPVGEGRPVAREKYRDRAAESYAILAEFVRAGQVRGLSREAVSQLCSRRWATRSSRTGALAVPLRLEQKEIWASREKRQGGPKSPNKCDAAAVAAVVVKERLGLLPWSHAVPDVRPSGILPGHPDFFSTDTDVPEQEAYSQEWATDGYSVAGA